MTTEAALDRAAAQIQDAAKLSIRRESIDE
jgi:hypothetical protein